MNSPRASIDYLRRGWSPIPLQRRSKEPKLPKGHKFLERKATREEFLRQDFRHNVGIVTGKVSGVVVLDDDDGGQTLKERGWHVPPTPTVRTRRGHQFYFKCPPEGFPTFDVSEKLEVRGDGAYVVAPPSIHPSGHRYEWVISPDEAPLADPPDWLIARARSRSKRRAEPVGEEIPKGARNKTYASIAGTLRRRGLGEEGIFAALRGIDSVMGKPPLEEEELRKIAASVSRYEPAQPLVEVEQKNGNRNAANQIEDVCAAEVVTKQVEWLWQGRVPKAKLTMFDGDPDLGKSVVTLDIAARVSKGRAFPDGAPCEVGNVLIANVEDGADDTIVPRLKAHGADLSRVFLFSSVPDGKGSTRLLELPKDLALLENKIRERRVALLIIDPVLTMLGGDANKDQDARKALTPVREMAERMGVAVICVRHLNKSVGLKAIQRGGGNMGLIGVARAGAFFAEHPDDDRLRIMAAHKSNLAEKPPSLAYRIVPSVTHNTARVEWKGATEHDANSLAANNTAPHERDALDAAKEFLREELADGPVGAKQVFKDAHLAGISDITLRRAKAALGVESKKSGTEEWVWRFPPAEDDPQDDQGDHRDRDHLDHLHDSRLGKPNPEGDHDHRHDNLQNGGNPAYLSEDDQDDQDDHPSGFAYEEYIG